METKNYFYLKCISCGNVRRDVKNDKDFSITKSLLKKYNVLEPLELQKVYLCRNCRKKQPETSQKTPDSVTEGRVNEQNKASSNADSLIPKQNDHYISRKIGDINDFEFLKKCFQHNQDVFDKKSGKWKNIMIVGETGSGKSFFARAFAAKMKLPYKRINLNGATTPEDLCGQFIPKIDRSFGWQDGWLTLFMRDGGILVLDELNMASADILAILNSVLDDERSLTLTQKDGEIINAHRNFFAICTMNLHYEGTKELNLALKDRFSDIIVFDYEKKIEGNLLKNKKIIQFAEKLRDSYKKGEIMNPVSTRSLIYFADNFKNYGEYTAIEIFSNRFEETEKNVVKELWKILSQPKQEEKKEEAKENAK